MNKTLKKIKKKFEKMQKCEAELRRIAVQYIIEKDPNENYDPVIAKILFKLGL